MTRTFRLIGVAALLCGLSLSAARGDVAIPGVPFYPWYYGCGPTAGGMIIGYWDANGYGNLVPGSNDWATNQTAIETMIASAEHIADYWGTDADPPLHTDNSVADFMHTSRDPFADGDSPFSRQDDGLVGYSVYSGYVWATAANTTYIENDLWDDGTYWNDLCAEIDANRPVELYVDKNADGTPDHFVAVYGYDDATGQCIGYDPSDATGEKRFDFTPVAPGQAYGVRGSTFFAPTPEPATLALLGVGAAVAGLSRYFRRRGVRQD